MVAALERTGARTVAGTPDFEVQEYFPSHLDYREADRVFRISAEMTGYSSAYSILLFDDAGNSAWQPPHHAIAIPPEHRRRILVRIMAALSLLGIKPDWQALPPEAERDDWPAIRAEAAALLQAAR